MLSGTMILVKYYNGTQTDAVLRVRISNNKAVKTEPLFQGLPSHLGNLIICGVSPTSVRHSW